MVVRTRAIDRLRQGARRRLRGRDERGDIPGWVMITVMTIVIASAILGIFQEQVTSFLEQALGKYM